MNNKFILRFFGVSLIASIIFLILGRSSIKEPVDAVIVLIFLIILIFIVALALWVISLFTKKNRKEKGITVLLCIALFFTMTLGIGLYGEFSGEWEHDVSNESSSVEANSSNEVPADEEKLPVEQSASGQTKDMDWLNELQEHNCSETQIADMVILLNNVGIYQLDNVEIRDGGAGMQTIKGRAYYEYPDEVTISFTVENGVIIFINVYCPAYASQSQATYLTGLEDRRAWLYDDTSGGYLKKIDWENKSVVNY